MTSHPAPEGYHTVTPYLIVDDADRLIRFLTEAFGAEEQFRVQVDGHSIGHAEVHLGDSTVMTFEPAPGFPASLSFLRLYVDDADAVFRRALDAGATAFTEVDDTPFGDRLGRVKDPAGNLWWIQQHIRLDPGEVARREAAAGWTTR